MAVWSEVRLKELTPDLRVDADYYRPEYLEMAERLHSIGAKPWGGLAGGFVVGPFGSAFLVENFVDSSSSRYIRGRDVKPFFLLNDQNCFISDDHFSELQKYHVEEGDILVSVVGTLGNVSIITSDVGHAIFSCKSTLFRSREIDPYYLCAYLNCTIARSFFDRLVRGHIQTGLNLGDLKGIPIPRMGEKKEHQIGATVRLAYSKREESKARYNQAEGLLIESLGIKNLDFVPSLFYERPYHDVEVARRTDAEFFQPKYQRMMSALKSTHPERIVPLDEYLTFLTNGHTPLHHDLSVGEIPFLTAEHVFDFKVNYDSDRRIERIHHEGELKRTQLRVGDFLITIKGRIGNAAVVEDLAVPTNINQDVALLRLKEGLPPYYLLAYLNSIIGKCFSEQYSTGQINPFLGLGNLKLLPIPIYDHQRMTDIADETAKVIKEASEAGEESKRLLEEAKHMIDATVVAKLP